MRPAIFVSYSHRDAHLVGPVVALLRASEALVFKDSDNLKAGKRWREQIKGAIGESGTVLVFWCHHASSSHEVRSEYLAAIELGKDVLPVLVDGTPLPLELAEYHYIDFRSVFPHGHAEPPAPPATNRIRWVLPSLGTIAVVAAIISSITLKAPTSSGIPESAAESLLLWLVGLAAFLFFVFAVARSLYRRNDAKRMESRSVSRVTPEQKGMASTIAAELNRRSAASEA